MTKIIINKDNFSKIKAKHNLIVETIENNIKLQNLLFFILLNIADNNTIYRGIEIKKGQSFISKKEIHNVLKISYEYINEMISILKNCNMIDYEEISYIGNKLYLLITVIDCDCYEIKFEE